jgi:AraC-like DNA-binding protein
MDALNPLFTHFSLNARVFFSGTLCAPVDFVDEPGCGYLHVLRKGSLRILGTTIETLQIDQPSLLLLPRPTPHRFYVDNPDGANLVCAYIDFGGISGNPLLSGLPDVFLASMAAMPGIESVISCLFEEGMNQRAGRQASIDRLMEYCMVLLLRHAIERQLIQGGVLAGLSDPRLARAMTALHEKPEQAWTLEDMAAQALMSRASFAKHFHATVQMTPYDYLTDWRISVARVLLKKGTSLKMVAPMVGYGTTSALSKVFSKKMGLAPLEWLESTQAQAPAQPGAAD